MRPNETFSFIKNNHVHQDLGSLTRYYLPLMGPRGMALYAYLLTFKDQGEGVYPFTDILSYLNVGMADFEDSLATLTALQLVDFAQLETGSYRVVLHSPLDGTAFFNHQVLTKLLERHLGDVRVKELKQASLAPATPLNHQLSSIFNQVEDLTKQPLPEMPQDFDLSHFKQLMARDNLRFSNETEDFLGLCQYAEKTGKTWYETYQVAKETAVNQVISIKRLFRTLETQPQPEGEFSKAEHALIRWSKGRKPLEFLADIKQARQAAITSSERQFIQELSQLGLLDGVINVILFYTFQKLDSGNLNEKYALKLGNDLSYQGINTPEAAVTYLRQGKPTSGERRQKTPKSNTKTNNVPEWSKESYRTEATPEELERLEALRRRMLGGKEE